MSQETLQGGIEDAIGLALEAHRGQVDKAGAPYVLHPLRVMGQVEGEAAQIVAVLHDTVEDCGVALTELEARFGATVAQAVDALTRRNGETYDAFIERAGANPLARQVKRADIADNMNLKRLSVVTAKDEARVRKYARALAALDEAEPGHGGK